MSLSRRGFLKGLFGAATSMALPKIAFGKEKNLQIFSGYLISKFNLKTKNLSILDENCKNFKKKFDQTYINSKREIENDSENPKIKKIIEYIEKLNSAMTSSFKQEKFVYLNEYINKKITYKGEKNNKDEWQTALETLNKNSGDCEDFAILKYILIENLGYSPKTYIIIGGFLELNNYKRKISGLHATLIIYLSSRDKYLILDNNYDSHTFSPESYLLKFEPLYAFNYSEKEIYKFTPKPQ